MLSTAVLIFGSTLQAQMDPPFRDSVRDWNAIAIEAVAQDHTGTFGVPDQGGPTRTSRALAIVHAAMFDAANSIFPTYEAYLLSQNPGGPASLDAAVARAARNTLRNMYPKQAAVFDSAFTAYVASVPTTGGFRNRGIAVGNAVAANILAVRTNDGSQLNSPWPNGFFPGEHQLDPINPGQGFLTPDWGFVDPFAISDPNLLNAPSPPALTSLQYAGAYKIVKELGGDGISTPTNRTPEQTEIGIYWGYDGSRFLGVPPRMYNQIARVIAQQQGNTEMENARFYALINISLADAGISSWFSKYDHNFWRPIIAIRQADPGTGPSGLGDGNLLTIGDTNWSPLGAPASNMSNGGVNFTPPFPAYTSGHATFGGALFRTMERFYGTDNISFDFVSDEYNGITTDNLGNVRPFVIRHFNSFSQAAAENGLSRIFLGIHWDFDATEGVAQGYSVADEVFNTTLKPLNIRSTRSITSLTSGGG